MPQTLLFDVGEKMQKIGRDTAFLAMSALQKAIRRGRSDLAVLAARAVFLHSPFMLWRRLWTICGEDCARDWGLIETMAGLPKTAYKDWQAMKSLTVQAAEAIKSGEAASFVALWDWFNRPDMLPGELAEEATAIEAGDWPDDVPSWMHTFMRRSLKFENFHLFLPAIFRAVDGRMPDQDDLTDDAVSGFDPDETFEDLLLLSAVDQHTRPGSIIVAKWAKEHGIELELMKQVQWYAVSRAKRPLALPVLGGEALEQKVVREKYPSLPDEIDRFREQFEDFQSLQRWALETLAPKAVEELRQVRDSLEKGP